MKLCLSRENRGSPMTRPGIGSFGRNGATWGIALALATFGTSAVAQDYQGAPPGAFIFQRNVETRAAEEPGVPAKPDYVVLGGKDIVLGSLGLQPMTDAEQAQVTADLAPQRNIISDTVSSSLDVLTSDRASTRSSLASEQGGGYVGGAISGAITGAMSAVPAAMGALRSAMGSDR